MQSCWFLAQNQFLQMKQKTDNILKISGGTQLIGLTKRHNLDLSLQYQYHVVSRAECVSIFDANLRKYVMYSRVHLSNLIGPGFLESTNALLGDLPGSNLGPSVWQTAHSIHYTTAVSSYFM